MHAIISGRLFLKIREAALSSGVQRSSTEVGTDLSSTRVGDAKEMKPMKKRQSESQATAERRQSEFPEPGRGTPRLPILPFRGDTPLMSIPGEDTQAPSPSDNIAVAI